jgi:hypothetical protein
MLLIIIIRKGYAMACLLLGSSEARSPVGFFWGPFVAWSDLVAAMIGKGAGKAVYKQGASLHRSVQSYNLTNPLYTDPYHFTVLKYQKGPFRPKWPQMPPNNQQPLPNCQWLGTGGDGNTGDWNTLYSSLWAGGRDKLYFPAAYHCQEVSFRRSPVISCN